MEKWTIIFNPKCQTCHKALAELTKKKIKPAIREYMKEPLSQNEVKTLLSQLKLKPEDLLRKKDKVYKELNLEKKKPSGSQLIKLMAENPSLIERPVVVKGSRAIIARPPKKVKELF